MVERIYLCRYEDLKNATHVAKDLGNIAFFTSELARAGAAVIVTSLAPKREDQHQFLQTVLHGAGTGANVFHIHVATPLEHAEATDRRKVYARARRGELNGLPGVDGVEYETPERPDLLVDITAQGIPEIVHSESIRFPFIESPPAVMVADPLAPPYRVPYDPGVILLLEATSLV